MPGHFSRYRKKYGQHFLNSATVAKHIVDFADIEGKSVLEIGAGKGMLTKQLAPKARKVYAVEIDGRLVASLRAKNLHNVHIVHGDFLTLDLIDYEEPVVVGNIPYSITSKIIGRLINQVKNFSRAVLMVQKEYGDKMLAPVGSPHYGALTACISYHFAVKKGFAVSARFFSPRPRISSVIIALQKIEPPFIVESGEHFFEFVSGLFRYRRKSLKNALKHLLHVLPNDADTLLLRKRPVNADLRDFYNLYQRVYDI